MNFTRYLAEQAKPKFVLVIGGAGSGKNYFIEHDGALQHYVLVDVDVIKKNMELSAAIKEIKPRLEAAFKRGDNVVHPTTGSSLVGQQNKIALARKHGYEVELILIDTPARNAVKGVADRAATGGHDVAAEDIVKSNAKARENFGLLKTLVDGTKVIRR